MKNLISKVKKGDDKAISLFLTAVLVTVVTILATVFITMANIYGTSMTL